ncbi:MAG: pyridoxamine 5'-phosphate oxidase family protein [Pseudomonadota bacterium]
MVEQTARTKLNRLAERASYDEATIYKILDAMPMCHVAYQYDGKPAIVPTLQWREDNRVYWHGSTGANSNLHGPKHEVCMNVCIFDGLVLARSAFFHSANFRSVTIFGVPDPVSDHEEKEQKLKNFVESLYPGRWDKLRPVKAKEIRATSILSLEISEASAKARSGPPGDEEEDYGVEVWAGVLPIQQSIGAAIPDTRMIAGVEAPSYLNERTFD